MELPCASCVAALIAIVAGIVYYKIKSTLDYFEKRKIPYVKNSICFRQFMEFLQRHKTFDDFLHVMYEALKDHKIGGFFQFLQPVIMVKDPAAIEAILIKDFSHFTDHSGGMDFETNPLDGNLFHRKGQDWKFLRTKLSPIFTTGKIKWMFDQVIKCGDNLVEYFSEIATGEDVDYKKSLSSYGTDVIGSCTFGLDTQALKNPNSKFVEMATKIFQPSRFQLTKILMYLTIPKVAKFLKLQTAPSDVNEFFINLTRFNIERRIQNDEQRNDFLQLLLQLKQQGFVEESKPEEEDKELLSNVNESNAHKCELTYEVLAAQTFIFFAAGLETASTALAYTLYFLSIDQVRQEKVREEIKKCTQSHGGVTYEALKNMTYLDCCISEALRMVTPTRVIIRECTKDYNTGDFTIEKGSLIMIPIQSIHLDEKYYDEPKKFIPERFLDSGYSMRQGLGVYLPFGDGPRVCIARRFALIQVKVALVKIIQNFEILESSKKIADILHCDPMSFSVQPKGGLHIKVQKIVK